MGLKIFGKKSLNMVKVESTKQTKDIKQTYNQNTLDSVMYAVKFTAELGYIATNLHDTPDLDARIFNPIKTSISGITKQRGGAIPNVKGKTPGSIFYKFLKDSDITVLPANGSVTARVAILTLKHDSDINLYTDYSSRTFTNPIVGNVTQLLVKFVLVGDNTQNAYTKTYENNVIEILTMEAFKNEMENINQVAISTANDDHTGRYEKASPYVVYATGGSNRPASNENESRDTNRVGININQPFIHPNKYKGCDDIPGVCLEQSIIDLFIIAVKRESRSWGDFKNKLSATVATSLSDVRHNVRLGVIAMTLAPGLQALTYTGSVTSPRTKLYDLPMFKESAPALIVEIIRTVFCAELLHTDLHLGNYFISEIPDEYTYGRRVAKPYKHRITLIDFGRTVSTSHVDTIEKASVVLDSDILSAYRDDWIALEQASDTDIKKKLEMILEYIIEIVSIYENTRIILLNALTALADDFAKTTPDFFEVPGDWRNMTDEYFDVITTKLLRYYKSCIEANTVNMERIKRVWGGILPHPLKSIIEECENYEKTGESIWQTITQHPDVRYARGRNGKINRKKKTTKKRTTKKRTLKKRTLKKRTIKRRKWHLQL